MSDYGLREELMEIIIRNTNCDPQTAQDTAEEILSTYNVEG